MRSLNIFATSQHDPRISQGHNAFPSTNYKICTFSKYNNAHVHLKTKIQKMKGVT